jgi:hypothetical protein
MLKPIRAGIRRLFSHSARTPTVTARDVDAEIASHFAQRVESLVARGYSRDEALAEASRRFGDVEAARRQLIARAESTNRAMNVRERVATLRQDAAYSLRRLMRQPGVALVAIVTLAVGVGANTTVFAWMDGLVLNPLPVVRDINGLVALSSGTPSGATQSISYPDYVDWARMSHALRDVVAFRRQQLSVRFTREGDAKSIWGVLASSNYFAALGVEPTLGRFFRPEESSPAATAGAAPVVVIGYDMWQRQFGGGNVLGTPI